MTSKAAKNADRRERAETAIAPYDNGDVRDNLVDLLTDLRHLCHREKIDFLSALQTSAMHFEEEV